MMQIDKKSPFDTPVAAIGGEAAVQALVGRFYDLMEPEPEPGYAALRATHGSSLGSARQRLFWFLCGWLGGPSHYVEQVGEPLLPVRHMPFAIGIEERDQWLACTDQAMGDTGVTTHCAPFCAPTSFKRPTGCATNMSEINVANRTNAPHIA